MKKILLAAAIMGSVFAVNAQDTFAPKKGDFGTEIQFAPFSGDKIFSNGGVLSGRYFVTKKDAVVIELGLAGDNEKHGMSASDAEYETYGEYSDPFVKSYNGTFTLNIGYQRHFYTYKRLDLYCGAKIGYYHTFAGYKAQGDNNNYTWNNKGTGNGFNAYLTTGLDFYVYKGLYIGAEINVGISDIVYTNTTAKTITNGIEEVIKTENQGHNLNGGFKVNPLLRLGWTF